LDSASYRPIQNGIKREVAKFIEYREVKPGHEYSNLVHCFWSLNNKELLDTNFQYVVLPDACIDIVFDIKNNLKPIIMTPMIKAETLNLGKKFHYIGIRFKPGVFSKQLDLSSVIGKQQNLNDVIRLAVSALKHNSLLRHDECLFDDLQDTVQILLDAHIIMRNIYIENTVGGLQYGLSVGAIAEKLGVSERQLHRSVLRQTGFSPVQLRRVIRLQSVLSSGEPLLRFADQSHLIKEFKSVTGVSYKSYVSSYTNVRKVQS